MIKKTAIVGCTDGHKNEVGDPDGKINAAGYMPCPEKGCLRNAWVVKVFVEDDGEPVLPELKAWTVKIPVNTENDMEHLDSAPFCGEFEENKALKKELETFREAFYLLEETSTEVENERDAEIQALQQSRDELFDLIQFFRTWKYSENIQNQLEYQKKAERFEEIKAEALKEQESK